MRAYTGPFFVTINKMLRGLPYDKTSTWEIDGTYYTVKQIVIKIMNILVDPAIPVTKKPITLWRGVGGNYIKDKSSWWEEAFLSASSKKTLAFQFTLPATCCVLKITIPIGTPIVNLQSLSYAYQEDEFLFGSESLVLVTGTEMTNAWGKMVKQYNVRLATETEAVNMMIHDSIHGANHPPPPSPMSPPFVDLHPNPPKPDKKTKIAFLKKGNKIKNPATGRWVLKSGKIGKKLLKNQNKNCPKGKIVNPTTNRCVKMDGMIGKKLFKYMKLA